MLTPLRVNLTDAALNVDVGGVSDDLVHANVCSVRLYLLYRLLGRRAGYYLAGKLLRSPCIFRYLL